MFPYSFAQEIAEDLVARIRWVCDRVEIAGSLRRRTPYVNDIDIVALPRSLDLLNGAIPGESWNVNFLEMRIAQLVDGGCLWIEKRTPHHIKCLREHQHESISIDLYCATRESWATVLLFRTGSRGHNLALACRALQRNLHLRADGSGLYEPCGRRLELHSEREVFDALGAPYKEPHERE